MARTRTVVGLVLTWQIADSFLFLRILFQDAGDGLPPLLGPYLFYKTFFLSLFAIFLARQVLRRERGEVQELLAFDLTKQIEPFLAVGVSTAALLALLYTGIGLSLRTPSWEDLVWQALVTVPYETFIFVFFLPLLQPSYVGVPSWIWASAYFGGFHFFAYGAELAPIVVAAVFNMIWYWMYVSGSRYTFLGLGSVMAMHFAINLLALAARGTVAASVLFGALRALGIW